MTILKTSVHPGEILKHGHFEELVISAGKLAKHVHVLRTRVARLCEGRTSATPDTAKRLSKAFGPAPEFWLNLQTQYDVLMDQAADIEKSSRSSRLDPHA